MAAIRMTGVLLCNFARSAFETEFKDPDTNVILPANNFDDPRRRPATDRLLSKGYFVL